MCANRGRRFTATADGPAQARQFVRQELAGLLRLDAEPAGLLYHAELLTSELAANAVKAVKAANAVNAINASRRDFAVTLAVHHRWVQVSVLDRGPGRPELLDPGPREPGGRGLQIVAAVATDWGTRPDPAGGKTVWFRLPLPPGAADHLACWTVGGPGGPRTGLTGRAWLAGRLPPSQSAEDLLGVP